MLGNFKNALGAILISLPGLLAAPASAQAPAGGIDCPQPRFTGSAPEEYLSRQNPLQAETGPVQEGARLYQGTPGRISCATCHGVKGDGRGPLASQFNPPPRNFACAKTISGVPDGQLFWIIRFGSPGAAMPPHRNLSDEQIWQLVLYLRSLSK